MPDLSSDPLLRSIRDQCAMGVANVNFTIDVLKLCDLFEDMRDSALRMERIIHDFIKDSEKVKI